MAGRPPPGPAGHVVLVGEVRLDGPLFTLAQVFQERQYRYGGGGEVDAGFKFRECSRVLLFNARWARQALDLADELGR